MKRTVALLTAPRTFEFVEEEIPALGSKQVLVKTISVGLCHSDLPSYLGTNAYGLGPKGRYVMTNEVNYPLLKGHEPVGQVVDVGSEVKGFKVGDYVTGHMQGMFATTMSMDDISSLVKMQLTDMARWDIHSFAVTGKTGSAVTYSMPGQNLSVMFENEVLVAHASGLIQKVMDGQILTADDISGF